MEETYVDGWFVSVHTSTENQEKEVTGAFSAQLRLVSAPFVHL